MSGYGTSWGGTTGTANYAVVGDLSQFYVIQRAGMSVELIPTVFDQATGRPSGSRGLFATARHGFDVANPAGFRLLSST